jgi:hypothetical protein
MRLANEPVTRLGVASGSVLVVVVVGALSAIAVHRGCLHPPPPVVRPDPGTPRAEYCSAVIPTKPWILLTLAPCAFVVTAAAFIPRARVVALLTLAVCVILIANAFAANMLTSALTI